MADSVADFSGKLFSLSGTNPLAIFNVSLLDDGEVCGLEYVVR